MVDATSDARTSRPLRLGMVGGGRGAFIGAVHRLCARMDGQFDLVAGAPASRAPPAPGPREGGRLPAPPGRTHTCVQAEYVQDWLSTKLEDTGHKQAGWRVDPLRAGAGGCLGDIGTHAYHLADFVTGLHARELAADLGRFVEGRRLDDNAHVLLRYESGARGMLWASQVAPGNENGLRLRVYGDKAGLEWSQEHPNQLRFSLVGRPPQVLSRGGPCLGAAAAPATRIPAGHPQGSLGGFADLYREFALPSRAPRR